MAQLAPQYDAFFSTKPTAHYELRTMCAWGAPAQHTDRVCQCPRMIRATTDLRNGTQQVEYLLDPTASEEALWLAHAWVNSTDTAVLLYGHVVWDYALSQC